MKIKYTWNKATGAKTWWAEFDSTTHAYLVRELEKISEWVMQSSCDPNSDLWKTFTQRDRDIWGRSGHNKGLANSALSRLGGLLDKAKRRQGDWSYDQFASMQNIFILAHGLDSQQFTHLDWLEIKDNLPASQFNSLFSDA
jgi:hypothetical protein